MNPSIQYFLSSHFAGYLDHRMLSELGLTPGQAQMLRTFAVRTIDEYVAAEEAQ
jgi:hypothetical protein